LPLGQLVLGVSRGIGCRFPGQLGFQDRHGTLLAGLQLVEQDSEGLLFRIQQQVGRGVGIIAGVVGQDVFSAAIFRDSDFCQLFSSPPGKVEKSSINKKATTVVVHAPPRGNRFLIKQFGIV